MMKTAVNMFAGLKLPREKRRGLAMPWLAVAAVAAVMAVLCFSVWGWRHTDHARPDAVAAQETMPPRTGGYQAVYDAAEGALPEGADISGMTLRDGVLTLDCVSADSGSPAAYAAALDRLGLFSAVEYGGFSQNGDGYAFTVVCALGGGAQ